MDPSEVDVSVIVPVRDEEASIPKLAEEISEAMGRTGKRWECIWVDDGSTDGTRAALAAVASKHPQHRFLELDGQFGQSAALSAGFERARGSIVATLDGDGQNDPADIPRLLERLERGDVDMVNGVRQKRRDSFLRRLSSRIGNGFRNWVTGERVSDVGCSLRVFRKWCVEGIVVFRGMHRFLPTLARMQGARIAELPVNHRPRTVGRTKYGIGNRLWVGIADTLAVRWMQRRLVRPKIRGEARRP